MLVQPIERGGLGVAPSEARKLTIEEALFMLADEAATKRTCAAQNRASHHATPEQNESALFKLREALRLKYTGSTEISGDG